MRNPETSPTARWPASPWVLLLAVVLMLAVVAAFAGRNIHRDRAAMSRILVEKGAALIRSFEAGTRTGMMGMRWGRRQIQTLLEETARQEDILYIAVCSPRGVVLAHSDPSWIGRRFHAFDRVQSLGPIDEPQWRVLTINGRRTFEVFRRFEPVRRGLPGRRFADRQPGGEQPLQGSGAPPSWCLPGPERKNLPVIFVGLDVEPFAAARARDVKNTVMLAGVLLLVGFGGIVSLFWAESSRNARRLLQDKSAFADVVVKSMPLGLAATDPEGKVAFFNAEAEHILGVEASRALGRDAGQLFDEHAPDLAEFLRADRTVAEAERTVSIPGRGKIPLSVSSAVIKNPAGGFVGRVIILRDLGPIRRLEEEVRRKDKLAAIGGLAAGVAHEIRNPLSSIKGMATYFGGKFAENSEDREAARVMVQEVERLNRAVTQLLEFARPADITPRKTDVNHLLEHSLRLVREDARAKGVEVEFSADPGLPEVSLDPDRMAQCLLNLYLNAIEAMREGGTLSVSARARGGEFFLSVSDTGRGMDAAAMKKIFDPYYTTKPTGTGLGLAVVHKIVESHGGKITVQSEPGQGAAFTVILPVEGGEPHAG
ncbi:MAG: PAS domain-containing protein [Deltaproteobacteria bacterium]|nr:PAS domain-containing protein [Deltaproteobacteria bacterium]